MSELGWRLNCESSWCVNRALDGTLQVMKGSPPTGRGMGTAQGVPREGAKVNDRKKVRRKIYLRMSLC